MTNQNEIPEILGAEFTRARERAGFSTIDLAKMASLTTSHVEQIENGESSSFYSPAIKFVAAKKLASFLGLPETECFVYPEGVVTKSTKIQAAVGEADLTNKVHVSIAKENFDKLLLATQELDNKKSKFYKKPSFYFLAILLLAGVFASAFARADIVGVMPAYGERLVITSETCKWDNGREEPNWLLLILSLHLEWSIELVTYAITTKSGLEEQRGWRWFFLQSTLSNPMPVWKQ